MLQSRSLLSFADLGGEEWVLRRCAMPGDLTLGPVAATRKMCPETEMAVEDRYLEAVGRVVKCGFMNGRLVLTTQGAEKTGPLVFEAR